MNTFFNILIFTVLAFAIYFFVILRKNSENKQAKRNLIFSVVLLLILGGLSGLTTPKKTMMTNALNSNTSASSTQSLTESSETVDFSKISLGMTQEEVESILGKPSEKDENSMYYGENDLDFQDGKLFGGSPQVIQDAKSKQNELAKKQEQSTDTIKSFAKVFGNKTVAELQKKDYVYKSTTLADGSTMYIWRTGDEQVGTLMRLDSPDMKTIVYTYDGNNNNNKTVYRGTTLIK